MTDYKRWKNTYNFNQYDYNLIDDVYNNIKDDSRVIFIVRHAERWPDRWQEWWLSENWIEQAKSLWKRLKWWKLGNSDLDFYWGTIYKKAPQTSYYVWYGREHKPFLQDIKLFEKSRIEYEKILNSMDVIDPFYLTYEMTFEELEEKSINMANELCKLTEGHPFSFITSHDHQVIPLISWVTDLNIKFTIETRINYLSWIAIIINENTKEREVYPIRTLQEKSMILDDASDFNGINYPKTNKKNSKK